MARPRGTAQARAAAQGPPRRAGCVPLPGEAESGGKPRSGSGGCQSTLAPVDLTTAAQRVISRSMCACSASGVEPTGS